MLNLFKPVKGGAIEAVQDVMTGGGKNFVIKNFRR
jgi:hypothetical protein